MKRDHIGILLSSDFLYQTLTGMSSYKFLHFFIIVTEYNTKPCKKSGAYVSLLFSGAKILNKQYIYPYTNNLLGITFYSGSEKYSKLS